MLWLSTPVLPLAYVGAKGVRYAARGSKKLMKGFCHPPKGASILQIPAQRGFPFSSPITHPENKPR